MGVNETTRWSRARDLFLDLTELEATERAMRLADYEDSEPELAARVRKLLRFDVGPEVAKPALEFGPYLTEELIASGGMGEVWLARRVDGVFDRKVAVKQLRPGAASEALVQRFLRERQMLARLEHPFIARLLDGGKTERGDPYLVLEYVRGRHIDVYCREEDLGIRARVALFRQVLEAVNYAHACGIIHRDLKPANILVRDDGQPRLLDFGIARTAVEETAFEALTGTGDRLFTPEYASLEQVNGQTASEASDVFSLGVILYELLTGVGPWEGGDSIIALQLSILECDPRSPSRRCEGRVHSLLEGDLDTIIMHCLERRPEMRFSSVRELSDELERYLEGRPILTRPTAAWTRGARYIRRNPWAFAAWLLFSVSLLSIAIAWRSQRDTAERNVELAQSLRVGLEHARSLSDSDLNGEAVDEMRKLLETLKGIPGETELRLETMAELAYILNRVHAPEEALEWVAESALYLPEDLELMIRTRVKFQLAATTAYRTLDDLANSGAAADRAYEYADKWLPPNDQLLLEALMAFAINSESLAENERMEVVDKGIELATEYGPANSGLLGSFLALKAQFLSQEGQYSEGLECINESLRIDRWNHGESHGDVALSRQIRGTLLVKMNRLEEARKDYEAAFPIFDKMGHRDMAAATLRQIGEVKVMQGEYDSALDDLIEAYERHVEILGADAEACLRLDDYIRDVESKLVD